MRDSIYHDPNDPIVIIRNDYYEIAKSCNEAFIVGAFHLDFVGAQPIKSKTVNGISEAVCEVAPKRSIQQALSSLASRGWLIRTWATPEQISLALRQKTPQQFPMASLQCDWCKGTTIALQEHHHPIPRKDGGTSTVSICANCHFEFHQMQGCAIYEASDLLIDWIKSAQERSDLLQAI